MEVFKKVEVVDKVVISERLESMIPGELFQPNTFHGSLVSPFLELPLLWQLVIEHHPPDAAAPAWLNTFVIEVLPDCLSTERILYSMFQTGADFSHRKKGEP